MNKAAVLILLSFAGLFASVNVFSEQTAARPPEIIVGPKSTTVLIPEEAAGAGSSVRLTLSGDGVLRLIRGGDSASLSFGTGPGRAAVNIYESTAGIFPERIAIEGSFDLISAETVVIKEDLIPLEADIGHIIFSDFKPETGRDWVLYKWNLHPSTLIFDTADYGTQAAFFKRLAFFVEKPGFVGKILSDSQLEGRHGWNAHDYKADDLAAFFTKAGRLGFELGEKELLLRDILEKNGIIIKKEDGLWHEGEGVVLSVSRETLPNWRYRFLTHECLHSIFFTEEDFRSDIDAVFSKLDPMEVEFWKKLLDYRRYDVSNRYLLVNEFMAYSIQQPMDEVDDYFKGFMYHRLTAARPREKAFVMEFDRRYPQSFTRWAKELEAVLERYTGRTAGHLANIYPDGLNMNFFNLFPPAAPLN